MVANDRDGSRGSAGREDSGTQELADRSEAWTRAIQARDLERAAGFLEEDFALVLIQPARAVMPREQWLQLLPDYVVSEWKVLDQVIDVEADLAAVLQRVHMEATVMGEERNGTFVVTDIWRRSRGEWRVWRRHSTPMTAGEVPKGERHEPE